MTLGTFQDPVFTDPEEIRELVKRVVIPFYTARAAAGRHGG